MIIVTVLIALAAFVLGFDLGRRYEQARFERFIVYRARRVVEQRAARLEPMRVAPCERETLGHRAEVSYAAGPTGLAQ